MPLGELRHTAGAPKAEMAGHIVICPPGALNDRWSRRLPDPVTAMASGWMRIRQRARQRNVELPLVISDHADWDELTQTIRELAPREVWITHGREEALKHWCMIHQIKARELNLVGYEDEEEWNEFPPLHLQGRGTARSAVEGPCLRPRKPLHQLRWSPSPRGLQSIVEEI